MYMWLGVLVSPCTTPCQYCGLCCDSFAVSMSNGTAVASLPQQQDRQQALLQTACRRTMRASS